jgi:hypothetical protein
VGCAPAGASIDVLLRGHHNHLHTIRTAAITDSSDTQLLGLSFKAAVIGHLPLCVPSCRLLTLPSHVKESSDLLRPPGQGQHKASALKKKHAHKEAVVGPVLEVEAVHADGLQLKLQLQVVHQHHPP